MRILTVRQPWAWAIIHGGKTVENRTRNIAGDWRGPVAIHIGLARPAVEDLVECERLLSPRLGLEWAAQMAFADPTPGHIIGVVDLTDVHHSLDCAEGAFGADPCSPWAEHNYWHLVFANPRPLATPIPFRGALGLRTLDADTESRIMTDLEERASK